MSSEEPKFKKVVDGANGLSLGISMVVAVALGVGIGLLLKDFTGATWTLWVGVFIGIGGAISNVFKAYKEQKKVYDDLAKERTDKYKPIKDDEDDD